MYQSPKMYPQYPYYSYIPMYPYGSPYYGSNENRQLTPRRIELKDYGPYPYVVDIEEATKQNTTYRTALWTGNHLQVTLMSIRPGEDIGLEIHPDTDQFLRVEQGDGVVQMGNRRNNLTFATRIHEDSAIMIPAGTWHNVTNTGRMPLRLYSIYAPPHHPFGTVHKTKKDALAAERSYRW